MVNWLLSKFFFVLLSFSSTSLAPCHSSLIPQPFLFPHSCLFFHCLLPACPYMLCLFRKCDCNINTDNSNSNDSSTPTNVSTTTSPHGHTHVAFYVFDGLMVCGTSIKNRSLSQRLAEAEQTVQLLSDYLNRESNSNNNSNNNNNNAHNSNNNNHNDSRNCGDNKQNNNNETNNSNSGANNNDASVKFRVKMNRYYSTQSLEWVIQTLIPSLPCDTDGLILAPAHEHYRIGFTPRLLKWKENTKNTVDFRIRKHVADPFGSYFYQLLVVGDGGEEVFFDWITSTAQLQMYYYYYQQQQPISVSDNSSPHKISDKENSSNVNSNNNNNNNVNNNSNDNDSNTHIFAPFVSFEELDGKIVECYWNSEWQTLVPYDCTNTDEHSNHNNNSSSDTSTTLLGEENTTYYVRKGGWQVSRVREDKSSPNAQWVVNSIISSIYYPVTMEQLMSTLSH